MTTEELRAIAESCFAAAMTAQRLTPGAAMAQSAAAAHWAMVLIELDRDERALAIDKTIENKLGKIFDDCPNCHPPITECAHGVPVTTVCRMCEGEKRKTVNVYPAR